MPDNKTIREVLYYLMQVDEGQMPDVDQDIDTALTEIAGILKAAKPRMDHPEIYSDHSASQEQAKGYNQGIAAYDTAITKAIGDVNHD